MVVPLADDNGAPLQAKVETQLKFENIPLQAANIPETSTHYTKDEFATNFPEAKEFIEEAVEEAMTYALDVEIKRVYLKVGNTRRRGQATPSTTPSIEIQVELEITVPTAERSRAVQQTAAAAAFATEVQTRLVAKPGYTSVRAETSAKLPLTPEMKKQQEKAAEDELAKVIPFIAIGVVVFLCFFYYMFCTGKKPEKQDFSTGDLEMQQKQRYPSVPDAQTKDDTDYGAGVQDGARTQRQYQEA